MIEKPGKYVIEARHKSVDPRPDDWLAADRVLGNDVRAEHKWRRDADNEFGHWNAHHPRVRMGLVELRMRCVVRDSTDRLPEPIETTVPEYKPVIPPGPVELGDSKLTIADLMRLAAGE